MEEAGDTSAHREESWWEMQKVNIDEIGLLADISSKNVGNYVLYQITRFYGSHSQSQYYRISMNESDEPWSYLSVHNLDLYESYGIMVSDSHLEIAMNRRYALPLTLADVESRESLEAAVQKLKAECGCRQFTVCAILDEIDEGNIESVSFIQGLLHDVLPDCSVLNNALQYLAPEDSDHIIKECGERTLIDIQEICDLSSPAHAVCDDVGSILYRAYETLRSTPVDRRTTLFLKDASIRSWLPRYPAVAVLSILSESRSFYFRTMEMIYVKKAFGSLFSQEYMYAEDYLRYLASFPDISVITNSCPYLLVRNRSERPKISFSCIQTEFDLSTKNLAHGGHSKAFYNLEDIKVLSLRKVFGLSSKDPQAALAGMKALSDLFVRMDTYISDDSQELDNIFLNVSNVILFQYGGKTYLGYFSMKEAKFPMIAYPVGRHYTSFGCTADLLNEMPYDIRFYQDWDEMVIGFLKAGLVRRGNMFFRPTDYAKGLLLTATRAERNLFPLDSPFTIEEIGMFSYQTSVTRKYPKILKFVKKKYLLEYFVSAYGGPHPSVSTSLSITPDAWV